MPIMFNTLLHEANISLVNVRLLRHKDDRATKGRSPYELWRDKVEQFELYQSTQGINNRGKLNAGYWASFVGTPRDETLFVGLYAVKYRGLLEEDTPMPHKDDIDRAGSCDVYDLTPDQVFDDLVGKLFIDWGPGFRSWIQRADKQDKRITELRPEFKEPDFPGFLNFMQPLSKLDSFPLSWVATLQSSKGIYLLTCPKT